MGTAQKKKKHTHTNNNKKKKKKKKATKHMPVFSTLTHAWVALSCSWREDYLIEIWAIFRINSMSVDGVEEENTAKLLKQC